MGGSMVTSAAAPASLSDLSPALGFSSIGALEKAILEFC
jgi:hypothetical protein